MSNHVPPHKTASLINALNNSAKTPLVQHGFFGRQGGVSTGKYASLNAGYGSDDDPQLVRTNRARIAGALGTSPAHLLSVHQTHSTDVINIDTNTNPPWAKSFAWGKSSPHIIPNNPKADAIVTNVSGLAISALSADCSPVLFIDPKAKIIGAAHAGWRGAFDGITDQTINAMCAMGAKRDDIRAAIGPCLSQQHFEVGSEFVDRFLAQKASAEQFFVTAVPDEHGNPKHKFDIKAYLTDRLQRTGLATHHIQALPDCSYAGFEDYFSYRHNGHRGISDYGRNISAIMLV